MSAWELCAAKGLCFLADVLGAVVALAVAVLVAGTVVNLLLWVAGP
jgi:hypothetical protein